MHPTDPHLLARASGLWEHGRRAESLELLKERVRADPSDEAARRKLAEQYREMIAPDQAGRWGVAIPGWATPTELDRLARLLGHADVRNADLPEFLALPSAELPAAVVDLLPAVEGYRAHYADPARMSRRERKHAAQGTTGRRVAVDTISLFGDFAWWIAAGVFAFGVVVAWLAALFGAPVTQVTRWTVVVTLIVLAMACVEHAVVLWWARRRGRSHELSGDIGAWSTGAILLLGAVVALVVDAVVNGGAIRF